MQRRRITASFRRGSVGALLDAQLGRAGIQRGPHGELVRPQGLYLFLERGSAAATVEVTLGEPDGGAEEKREITLTRRGAWLSAAGWDHVRVEVSTLGAGDVVVGAAWTTEKPPSGAVLLWVETITPGTRSIPRGAERVQGAAADAGWAWVSNPAGVALTVPQPLPANASALDVVGDAYTATVANTLVWRLVAP
jgi:hypothetical protein